MTQASTPTHRDRIRRAIEALDLPLLVLAFAALGLYLVRLSGWIGMRDGPIAMLIRSVDVLFLADLILKVLVLGRCYLREPWFLVDLLSALPVLNLLGDDASPFGLVEMAPGLRALRVFRVARLVRVLRGLPAFEALCNDEAPPGSPLRKFHRQLEVCLILLTITLLLVVGMIRWRAETRFLDEARRTLAEGADLRRVEALGGSIRPRPGVAEVAVDAVVDGMPRRVYFPRTAVEARADEYEFFFGVGMLVALAAFGYLLTAHQQAVSRTQIRALLNLALPVQVADRFLHDPHAYERKVRAPATIIFLDLVGFTAATERLADCPDELATRLETALNRIVAVMARHDVIIDKFIGDAVMGFRGGPFVGGTVEDHAYRVVRAALEAEQALADLEDPTFRRVKIGGASAEDCLIGAFGTSVRLTYTILGDGVNLAARLEPASDHCSTANLFDARTRRLCGERSDVAWRRWGRVRVAGKSRPVEVHEALDPILIGDRGFLAEFELGLVEFERSDLPAALAAFRRADDARPGGDPPSRAYAARCQRLLAEGVAPDWEPVLVVSK